MNMHVGSQSSMMSFYGGRTSILDLPKYVQYEKEYFNITGAVDGLNRGRSYFLTRMRAKQKSISEDCTIIV